MSKPETHVVGIDIGSAKIAVLIGHRDESGGMEIVGKGLAPNRGTRRGNIVNVEATVEALKQAAEEAEMMAGTQIARAYLGLAGSDVQSVNVSAMVSVAQRDREITRQDVERVIAAARSSALPADREILHAIPQEFIVDEQGGVADPVGMLGSRLEVTAHLVTCHVMRSKTLLTCAGRAGIEVAKMVFEPLATAAAVLTPDEREMGTLLIDIGAATTGCALYLDSEVQYSAVIPIAAGHFSNDLATVLRTPFAEAERLKVSRGCCVASLQMDEEGVAVPTVAGGAARVVPRRELSEILQPRAEELLGMVREDLVAHGFRDLHGGVVLTGGGAQLDGLLAVAEQVFNCGVRYGLPRGLGGLVDGIDSPTWSTASGLLLYGFGVEQREAQVAKRGFFHWGSMVGSLRQAFASLL